MMLVCLCGTPDISVLGLWQFWPTEEYFTFPLLANDTVIAAGKSWYAAVYILVGKGRHPCMLTMTVWGDLECQSVSLTSSLMYFCWKTVDLGNALFVWLGSGIAGVVTFSHFLGQYDLITFNVKVHCSINTSLLSHCSALVLHDIFVMYTLCIP